MKIRKYTKEMRLKMCTYQIILSVLLTIPLTTSESAIMETYGYNFTSNYCDAPSYTPGNKTVIETTTAPRATLQKDVFQAFFTHVNTGHLTGILGISSDVAGTLENIKKVGKIATKLAPALGIIGGVMGTIIGDQTPTAEDILESTNSALEKMTEELDNRISEMKLYVDKEIIRLLKDINHRKYKFLYTYWSGCVKAPESESKLCQREAIRLIAASINEFAMYSDQLKKEGHFDPPLNEDERKKLEVNLILFRNYVFLSLMATKAVAATYAGEPVLFEFFNQQLKDDARFYKRYANSAINEIISLNTGFGIEKLEERFEKDKGGCQENSWMSVLKFSECKQACRAVLSPLLPKSQYCAAQVFTLVHLDDWKKHKSHNFNSVPTYQKLHLYEGIKVPDEDKGKMNQEIADYCCLQVLTEKQNAFKDVMRKQVREYWKNEVQQVIDCGEKLSTTDATTCNE